MIGNIHPCSGFSLNPGLSRVFEPCPNVRNESFSFGEEIGQRFAQSVGSGRSYSGFPHTPLLARSKDTKLS